MLKQFSISFVLLLAFTPILLSQSKLGVKPSNMWEVGVNGGYFFVSGDVSQKPGYAGGIHVRKASDFVFSFRGDFLYGKAKGENPSTNADRQFDMTWMSGTGFGVLSFNNFRLDAAVRKFNYYAMVGAGGNNFETKFRHERLPRLTDSTIASGWAPHVAGGAGIAIRLGKRVNIGVEHQVFIVMGNRADLLDGYNISDRQQTTFRDIANYTNLKINFNIGDKNKNTEPLYWISPFETVLEDLEKFKSKQESMLADSDGDGVIDAIDLEPNTPPGVPVDTRGRTLDSDKDGIPDYKDKEPFNPPLPGERVNTDGVVVNPSSQRGGGVTEDRVRELIGEALKDYSLTGGGGASPTEWFLPMIHFGTDSHSIKYSDYGSLAGIARMMKSNEQMRLVVVGFTDATGPESYNDFLSYMRAKAIVDHFVTNHGIGRGRLIIQWKGQADPLVPANSSYMNRRVEFRVATAADVEMDPPAKTGKSRDGF
jgi:OmpA-OmpF porin, OOP family